MKTAAKKDPTAGEKAKMFLKEIRRAIDKAVKTFSVSKAVGHKEELEDDESNESEEDHSIEFMDSLGTEKVIGPHIPTEKRIIVAQTLQKMESLWNEKKQMKSNALLQWRLKTAYEKLGQVKRYNDAFFTLQRLADKRSHCFFSSIAMKSASMRDSGESIDGNPYFDLKRPSNLSERPSPIRESFVIDRKVIPNPNSDQSQELAKLKRELESLRLVVKQKDLLIKSLEDEKSELLNEMEETYSQVLDSPMDKRVTTMNSARERPGHRINLLNHGINRQSTASPMMSSESSLHRQLDIMQKRIVTLESDLSSARKELSQQSPMSNHQAGSSVNGLKIQNGKGMINGGSDHHQKPQSKRSSLLCLVLARTARQTKLAAFMRLVKASVRSSRSKKEAGLRIKGRIIQVLREKYHSKSVRRSFLRWAVFVNKNFLRNCIMKVALNSKITHQSALWRLCRIVPREAKVKMSEADRNMQYAKGASKTEIFIRINNIISKVHAMNKMRPGVVGKVNRKLIDLLVKKAKHEEIAKLNTFYKLIRDHKRKKEAISRLVDACESKVSRALLSLQRHCKSQTLEAFKLKNDPDFLQTADVLSKAAKRQIVACLKTDKIRQVNNLLVNIARRMESRNQQQKSSALNHLSSSSSNMKMQSSIESFKIDRRSSIKSSLIAMIIRSMTVKQRIAVDSMRCCRLAMMLTAGEETNRQLAALGRKEAVLKAVIGRAAQSWKLKKAEAMARLQENKVKQIAAEELRRTMITLEETAQKNGDQLKKISLAGMIKALQNAERRALQKSFDALNKILNSLAADEKARKLEQDHQAAISRKIMLSCLNKLLHNSNERKNGALSKLILHKNNTIHAEELTKARDQLEQESKKKLTRNLFELLKLAQLGKTKEAYFNMTLLNGHLGHRDTIRSLNKSTEDKLRDIVLSSALDRLVKSHQAKQRQVTRKLADANEEIGKMNQQKVALMKKFAERMLNNRGYLTGHALAKLRLFNAETAQMEARIQAQEEKRENQKKVLCRSLVEGLVKAHKMKEEQVVRSLKGNYMQTVRAEKAIKMQEEAAKRLSKEILSKLLDKIKRANEAKAKEMLNALHDNSKDITVENQIKKIKDQTIKASLQNLHRLLGGRLGSDSGFCLKESYYKIKNFTKERELVQAQGMISHLKEEFTKNARSLKILERLRAACQAKQQVSLCSLRQLNSQESSKASHSSQLDLLKRKLKKKSVSFAMTRIASAQAFKAGSALTAVLEYSRRISRKEKMLNDLMIRSQTGKLRHALERLVNAKLMLESQEAMEMIMAHDRADVEYAKEELLKTKKIEFLHLLKRAQDAKAIDVVRGLQKLQKDNKYQEEIRNKVMEAENLLRNRKIKAFLSKLKMAQQEKMSHAISTLKEVTREIEAAQALEAAQEERRKYIKDKILRQMKHYIENYGQSRLQEAIFTLRSHNKEKAQEEAKRKSASKILAGCLVRAYCSKEKDALSILNTESLKLKSLESEEQFKNIQQESEEKIAKFERDAAEKRKLHVLSKLVAAQLSKQRECYLKVESTAQKTRALAAETELRDRLAEQSMSHKKQNMLKSLIGGHQGKLLEVLRLLRGHKDEELSKMNELEKKQYLENKKKTDMMRDLIHAQESKMLFGLQRLQRHVAQLGGMTRDAKKAKLLSNLMRQTGQKMQQALKKLIMEEQSQAAKAQSAKFKKISMLKTLQGSQEDKCRLALLRLLQNFRTEEKNEEVSTSTKKHTLDRLMSTAGRGMNKSREYCYFKLAQFTAKAKRDSAIKKQLLSNLIKASMGKVKLASNNLKNFSEQAEVVDKLNKTHMDLIQEKELLEKRASINKLISALHSKQTDCLDVLRNRIAEVQKKEQEKEKVVQYLSSSLRRGWNDAKVQAYKLMVNYAQINRLVGKRQDVLLEDMLRKLHAVCSRKSSIALTKLKDNNLRENLKQIQRGKHLFGLFKHMESAYSQKLVDALAKLQHNCVLLDSEAARTRHFKSNLVKKLVERQKAKQLQALTSLEARSKEAGEAKRHQQDLLKHLLRSLAEGSRGKLMDTFYALRNKAKDSVLATARNRMKLSKLVEFLVPAQLRKQNEALGNLRIFSIKNQQIEKDKLVNRTWCFKRLVAAQNAKSRDALLEFRRFNEEHTNRAKNAKDKLSYLIHKINSGNCGKLYDAMNLLIQKNSTERRLVRDMKAHMVYLLNRLVGSHFSKTSDTFNKLLKQLPSGKTAGERESESRSRLAKLLVSSQTAKQRQSLSSLQSINIVRRSMASSVKHVFDRLSIINAMKLRDAVDRLMRSANSAKTRENDKKSILTGLMNKIEDRCEGKIAGAMRKLIGYSGFEKEKEKRSSGALRFLVNKLGAAVSGKGSAALKDLVVNSRLQNAEDPEIVKKASYAQLIRALTRGSKGKVNDALRRLRERASRRKALLEKISNGLVENSKRLASQAFGKLMNRAAIAGLEDKMRSHTISRLSSILSRQSAASTRAAYNHLSGHRQSSIDRYMTVDRLIRHLSIKCKDDRIRVYSMLKAKTDECRRRDVEKNDRIEGVVRKLVGAQKRKVESGVAGLVGWRKSGEMERMREEGLKKVMVERLGNCLSMKTRNVLGVLESLCMKKRLEELNKKSKLMNLVNRLIYCQNRKAEESLKNMKKQAYITIDENIKKNDGLKRLIYKLESASRQKTGKVLTQLNTHKSRFNLILNRLRELGDKTKRNQTVSMEDAYRRLKSAAAETARKQREALEKGEKVKQRLAELIRDKVNNDIRKAYDSLCKNALRAKIREERVKKLLSDLAYTKEIKVQKVVNMLRLNNLVSNVKVNEKKHKLGKILNNMYMRLTNDGYNKLVKNAFMKQKLLSILNRAEADCAKRSVRQFYDKMIEILRDRPAKLGGFFDFLTSKIRLREQQGFSEIKLFLELHRREKLNKGLMKLIEAVNRAKMSRKYYSFNQIKSQFHVDNPWFRRVLTKMTVQVACSEQSTFWRIMRQENFGNAMLPVQTSIKLKKFAQLFEKKKTKLMQSSLERILARKDLTDSMLNASYLSFMHPSSARQSSLRQSMNMSTFLN